VWTNIVWSFKRNLLNNRHVVTWKVWYGSEQRYLYNLCCVRDSCFSKGCYLISIDKAQCVHLTKTAVIQANQLSNNEWIWLYLFLGKYHWVSIVSVSGQPNVLLVKNDAIKICLIKNLFYIIDFFPESRFEPSIEPRIEPCIELRIHPRNGYTLSFFSPSRASNHAASNRTSNRAPSAHLG
jgi:hypothetical protein